MEPRLPAHLEVSGLIRQVEAAGGFAMVLHKGEREAGTILVVLREKGVNPRVFERFPDVNGHRTWHETNPQNVENEQELDSYLTRRSDRDADLWIIELDIVNGERFIGSTGLTP